MKQLYYWIFQFYKEKSEDGRLMDVVTVEVKAESYDKAVAEAKRISEFDIGETTMKIRTSSIIVADKK